MPWIRRTGFNCYIILNSHIGSLGVAVVLGNLTGADTGVSGVTFRQAAQQEVDFLLGSAPRSSDGAISHRADEVGF